MTTRKLQPAHEAQPQIAQRRPQPDAEQQGVQRAAADSVLLQRADARQLRRIASTRPAQLRPVARQLQRAYGNRHVVGLLRLAREADAEEAVQRAVAEEDEEAVQRAVAEEDEEAVQRAVAEEDDEAIQRAAIGLAGGPAAPAVERAIAGARGGGQALDSGVRAQMEGAFDVNFGSVRVHTGHSADQLNRQLSARAFTTGSDIFFRQGAYRPGDADGRELLAHELTHVVQQGGGVRTKLIVGPAGDAYEREADEVARAVIQREQVGVQRQVEKEEEREVVRREVLRKQAIACPFSPQRCPFGGACHECPVKPMVIPSSSMADRVARSTVVPKVPQKPLPSVESKGEPDTGSQESLVQKMPNLSLTVLTVAGVVAQAVRDKDVGAAVIPLRERSVNELVMIRALVSESTGFLLERWFLAHKNLEKMTTLFSGKPPKAEEGIQRLWPALPLIDRLEMYDEGYREIEQAQLDEIRRASAEQKALVRKADERLRAVYANMDPEEEYEARLLIDPDPDAQYRATEQLLKRAPGPISDIEQPVFDAILDLSSDQRRKFFNQHVFELSRLLWGWQFQLVVMMVKGNEVDGLIARLRLAASDGETSVQGVVDRAASLLHERRQLGVALTAPNIPQDERAKLESRFNDLQGLEKILEFQPGEQGKLAKGSFMGVVAEVSNNPETFGAYTQQLAEFASNSQRYALEAGKQRILLAAGNVTAIQAAILSIHAPPVEAAAGATSSATAVKQHEADLELRKEVLKDKEVKDVVKDLTSFKEGLVYSALTADPFREQLFHLQESARNGRWGAFFQVFMSIACEDELRKKFEQERKTAPSVYSILPGAMRNIIDQIVKQPQHLPIVDILNFTDDVATLQAVFANTSETQRGWLRLGWSIARGLEMGPYTKEQSDAFRAFQSLENTFNDKPAVLAQILEMALGTVLGGYTVAAKLAAGEGHYEVVEAMSALLGKEPIVDELATDTGRYRAAALMYEHQEARLRLGRGFAAGFSETDETMAAAARQFGALWLRLRDKHAVSMTDFSMLSKLHQQFLSRAEEFTEASNTISELAGMIASTVAGIVVIAATGGVASPAVIALAAASGAGARVITRDMFGQDYYNALSNKGLRDALIGGIDGALAVVSGRLAARGAELLKLGGQKLTKGAARIAGEVTEQATMASRHPILAEAVESAFDGIFSSAASEAFGVLTDERAWRRGIWEGLTHVGQAALMGGLVGLGSGGAIGAATPYVRQSTKRLRQAIVGQGLAKRLEAVGAKETFDAAQKAAREGNVEEVNRLTSQLEHRLNPGEVGVLRSELGEILRAKLGHPPGTARPLSKKQEQLLSESGTMDWPNSDKHLEVEFDIVRRSKPQPSRNPDYIDEVDLGNGHIWRRNEYGYWCRFSEPSCIKIQNAPDMSPSDKKKARQLREREERRKRTDEAEKALENANKKIEEWKKTMAEYEELVNNFAKRKVRGERLDFSKLTDYEESVIERVLSKVDADLTLRELQEVRNKPTKQIFERGKRKIVTGKSELEKKLDELFDLQERAIQGLRVAGVSEYSLLRRASPTARLRYRVVRRASGLDEVSGNPPPSKLLEADHIVPLRQIYDMPGFRDLKWDDQVRIANYEDNFKAVDKSVNDSRGDKSWADKGAFRNNYSGDQLRRIENREAQLRVEILKEIEGMLRRRGRKEIPAELQSEIAKAIKETLKRKAR